MLAKFNLQISQIVTKLSYFGISNFYYAFLNNNKEENMKKTLFALSITLFLSANSQLYARDQIKIVGSSTVYPFATVVAERFGKQVDLKHR